MCPDWIHILREDSTWSIKVANFNNLMLLSDEIINKTYNFTISKYYYLGNALKQQVRQARR